MNNYDQELEAIIDLQEKGFDHDFILENENIRCLQFDELVTPEEFEILEVYHCVNNVKKGLNSIIYGVVVSNYAVKGILRSTYKSYNCGLSVHLWKKLFSKIGHLEPSTLENIVVA